jgi:hypothetical protein
VINKCVPKRAQRPPHSQIEGPVADANGNTRRVETIFRLPCAMLYLYIDAVARPYAFIHVMSTLTTLD